MRATAQKVELWHANTRVALHTRAAEAGLFITHKSHLPLHKQAAYDALHGRGIPHIVSRQRAADIGPFTQFCVEHLLDNPAHDRRRTVERLIGLADQHSKALLERACKHALESGDPSSTSIRTLFKLCLAGALPEDETPPVKSTLVLPRYARSAEELMTIADDQRVPIPVQGTPSPYTGASYDQAADLLSGYTRS